MNLAKAQHYAQKILDWLAPACERIEVAGSIRRRRPQCNDVDVVAIPKLRLTRDLFGEVTSASYEIWKLLDDYVATGRGEILRKGGDIVSVRLALVQLDIFFARPETWATTLLCRTGSPRHNIFLCERAQAQGKKWIPNHGVLSEGKVLPAESETDIFGQLCLHYIVPEERER